MRDMNRIALANISFLRKPSSYFNSASIGLEVKHKEKRSTHGFDWDEAVNVVQQKFGKLIGKPSQTISVFHNTTAGVQRILLRLTQLFGSSNPTLLMTDLEYPGIVSAVDETWPGRVVMAEVADCIWNGRPSAVTNRLKGSILISRPSVVYLSHISRATGYRIDEAIVDFIRENLPKTVIILDGAQACGNIHVENDLLSKIDFYVTSGHKWLCGIPTLGLVYSEEKWSVHDPAQSYSMTRVPTGTGSKHVILSLQTALQDFNGELTNQTARKRMNAVETHNAALAKLFCKEIKRKKLGHPLGLLSESHRNDGSETQKWKWNGIATIVFDSPEVAAEVIQMHPKPLFTQLSDESWRDSLGESLKARRYFLDPDAKDKFVLKQANFTQAYVPKLEGYPTRFCFHYYHSLAHVKALIAKIERAHVRVISRVKARSRITLREPRARFKQPQSGHQKPTSNQRQHPKNL